ncbi:MAG: undecaprenyl/decaprenyl-phosphate alpha-N-acetylglucosaminyl 1-phosphate transferase [Myxococcales bacterium]|nr:undecaprenyl/decaprenyl-phosphate alpha-N-acetylglucosaminyl 1-phosphate transferase [Myxococcales bacterium]
MKTYIVAFCLALVVAALSTPIVVWVAHRKGWLDLPNESRKVHSRAVPRLGGVAVVLAFFAPILCLALYENRVSDLLYSDIRLIAGLFSGALAIVTLGVYDDLRNASVRTKLLVQCGVASILWLCGFRIELLSSPVGDVINLGVFSLPLTVLWIVGVINALNLIDGLDGLASGVALLATSVLFGVAMVGNAILLCLITAALAGAIVGFLFWNFNPAKIFLGDSGSMFLGFVLSAVSIWTQQKGATAVALLVPVLALGLPILDTSLSFIRRLRKGCSPFQADKEHLHHRLLALGFSHRGAVLVLYSVSILFCLGALALLETDATHRAIVLSVMVAMASLLVRWIGGLRRLDDIVVKPVPVHRDAVRNVVQSVRTAETAEEAWIKIIPIFSQLNAELVKLTWLDDGADTADLRGRIFLWRKEEHRDLSTDKMDIYPYARSLCLEYNDRRLGELVSVFGYDTNANKDPTLPIYLELLAESLVEHRLNRVDIPPGEVVSLGEARRTQAG